MTEIKIINYDDNSFKLTGIIENREFSQGLKEIYLKLIALNLQNLISENEESFKSFIETLHSEFANEIDISYLLDIYPQNWVNFLHKSMNFSNLHVKETKVILEVPEVESFDINANKNKPKEEIVETTATKQPKLKIEENDMMMLLDDLENISSLRTEFNNGKNIKKPEIHLQVDVKEKSSMKNFDDKIKEVALNFFSISLNQRTKNLDSKLDEENLFKLFQDGGILNSRRWSTNLNQNIIKKAIECCRNAMRFALKIALEIYSIEGTLGEIKDETLKESYEETLKKWFIGNKNSEDLFKAISLKTESLMCLLYDFSKKETNVLRATRTETKGHVK